MPSNEHDITSLMDGAALEWVTKSWNIVFNPWNHPTLMKDEFFINSMVFFMDEQHENIITKALEICFLLFQNRLNHPALTKEQYVKDGLSLAFKRYRKVKNEKQHLYFLSKESLRKLKDVDYTMIVKDNLELKDKEDEELWGETEINFHIPRLDKFNKEQVHITMASVPGVVSVTSNISKKYATVKVAGDFSTSLLRSVMAARLLMNATVIHMRSVDWDFEDDPSLSEKDLEESSRVLPPYLPDIDSPIKTRGTVTTATDRIKNKASGIISWFQDSFYW